VDPIRLRELTLFTFALGGDRAEVLLRGLSEAGRAGCVGPLREFAGLASADRQALLTRAFAPPPVASELRALWRSAPGVLRAALWQELPAFLRHSVEEPRPNDAGSRRSPLILALARRVAREASR